MADISPEEQTAVDNITEDEEEEHFMSNKTSEDKYIQQLRDEVKVICQKLQKVGEDSVFLTANSTKKFCNFFGSPSGEEFLIKRIQVVKEFYTFCAGVARYKIENGLENDDDVTQEANATGSGSINQGTEDLTKEKVEVINHLVTANIKRSYNEAKKNENVEHICSHCDKFFHTNTTLRKHVTKCHNKLKSHACDVCKKAFYTAFDLSRHLSLHGIGEKKYECHLCGKKFCTSSGLLKHLRTHSTAKKYICKHCGFKDRDLSVFRRHIMKHNMEKYVNEFGAKTDIAKRRNSNKDQEENDSEISSDENDSAESVTENDSQDTQAMNNKPARKFDCMECGEKFPTTLSLKRHATKCKAIKSLSCDICNAKFKQVYLLKKHQRLKHNVNEQFNCEKCGAKFEQKYLLFRHKKKCGQEGETVEKMETEDTEMIFKCDDCGTQFEDADSVQKHIEENNSVKLSNAFKCDRCCKRFLTKRLLSKHRATHDSKLCKCDFCNKTFVTVDTLLQHMENEGHFKFSCRTCGQEFETDSDLKDHTTSVHDNA